MAITLLVISGICILGAGLLVVHAWIYRKKQKALLKELADEATSLIKRMRETRSLSDLATDSEEDVPEISSMLNSSKYLTTLITVLVRKAGGEVRLAEEDFIDMGVDEYVSVYVDTKDSNILLRLNSLAPFHGDDDEIVYN
jgi:hypothetical protein